MTAVMRGRGSAGPPTAAIIGGFITTVIILLYIARVPHNHTAPKNSPLFQRLDLMLLWAPCSMRLSIAPPLRMRRNSGGAAVRSAVCRRGGHRVPGRRAILSST